MANINNVTCFAFIIKAGVQQIKDLEENLCQQEENVMPKKEVRWKLKKAVLCWTRIHEKWVGSRGILLQNDDDLSYILFSPLPQPSTSSPCEQPSSSLEFGNALQSW